MTRIEQLVKFTILGIISLIIYFLHLSPLLDQISNFVFFSCVTFIILLSLKSGFERFIRFDKSGPEKVQKEFVPEPDNSLKTRLLFEKTKEAAPKKKQARYYAQERYRWIGEQGQIDLGQKDITVIGLGNSGVNSAELLARAGIGSLKLIDDEVVNTYDLISSKVFKETDLERPRAIALEEHLQKINSYIKIKGHKMKPFKDNLAVIDSDLVMDFSMEYRVKEELNRYCKKNRIPLLSMSVSATHGSIMVVGEKGPCLKCQMKDEKEGLRKESIITEHMGSALMVTLALQILLNKFLLFDILSYDSKNLEIVKSLAVQQPECDVCGERSGI